MTSLKDVARHARVSTATVSRVLNHPEIVIPITRERVERSLRTLKYIPSRVARRLRMQGGLTHILGLLLPDIQNSFFSEVARGVEDITYANNYALILCNANDDPDREKFYIDVMRMESVDGVLFLPTNETDPVAADMIRVGMPFVCVDRSLSNIDVDTVEIDNYAGSYQAMELLIKNGHRRIGFISGQPYISTSRGRQLGYEDALRDNRIPLEKVLIRNGDYRQESGRLLTEELPIYVTVWSTGRVVVPPRSRPASRQLSPASNPFRLWQAVTQALHPVHASRSTSNAYCCPAPGDADGIRSR